MLYVLSCHLCSPVPHVPRTICILVLKMLRALRPLVPHVSYALLYSCVLRFLVLLVPRAVCALLHLIPDLLQVF